MLIYAPNGYRLWDMKAQKIVISRDVISNKFVFPEIKPVTKENFVIDF